MSMITTLLLALTLQTPNSDVDGETLMRILEGLHSQIHDCELVCEGQVRYADTAQDLKENGPKNIENTFQGSFAYRAGDGAEYLDLYQKPVNSNGTFLHATYAQIKGKLTKTVRSADQKNARRVIDEEIGAPGALTFPCSPERFIFLHYWRQRGYRVGDIGYKFEAWDALDGVPVLRIRVNEFPKSHLPEEKWSRYWIDLKRGGHVIKHEFYKGRQIVNRTYNVVLIQVQQGNGEKIWFPVHGEYDSFQWGTALRPDPVFHETYNVVRGSLVLNRSLTDERFSVDWAGRGAETAALKEIAREYQSTPRKPAPPELRTDPEGVEEYQRQRLAEADRQAKQLDASPPSRRGWDRGILVQGILAALGVGILIAAFLLRRRAS